MSKKTDRFYYSFADSEAKIEIKAGEESVTQAHIDLLLQWEKNEYSKKVYRAETKECSFDELENVIGYYDDTADDEKDPKQERMEELLRNCIERLKPEQQTLIYEYYGMRKSIITLGEERGIKKQAVSSQLATIRRKLKKMLEEYE